jgi:hypothetical protein
LTVKKRTLIVAGIFLVSLGAGAAVMYSLPYVTIYRIIAAFENQDQRRLADLVDFVQIRENLKRYIGVKIRGDAASHGEASGIPDSLVNRIVERAVNELITPEGLAAFMKERLEALAAAGKGNGSPPPSPWSLFTAFLSHAELAYTSPAEFVVSFPAGESGTLRFVLRRSGFSWRLTNMEF